MNDFTEDEIKCLRELIFERRQKIIKGLQEEQAIRKVQGPLLDKVTKMFNKNEKIRKIKTALLFLVVFISAAIASINFDPVVVNSYYIKATNYPVLSSILIFLIVIVIVLLCILIFKSDKWKKYCN